MSVNPRRCGDQTAGAPIPLMINGEQGDGGSEEWFSLASFALDLLGPRR